MSQMPQSSLDFAVVVALDMAARRGRAPGSLTHRLDARERQNPHSLASVNRALVRFGLNHKLIALDSEKADLISSKSASVPFDVDMVSRATDCTCRRRQASPCAV